MSTEGHIAGMRRKPTTTNAPVSQSPDLSSAYGAQNAERIRLALAEGEAQEQGIKPEPVNPVPLVPIAKNVPLVTRKPARGRRQQHKTGEMNGLEAAYAAHLDALKALGEIEWYSFEKIVFHLAPRCTYRPDFLVMVGGEGEDAGLIEAHETKGLMRDDAAVKIRLFSSMFPIPIYVLKKEGKEWSKKLW
jgi:hypothetical protein